jgi:hypothetical protein
MAKEPENYPRIPHESTGEADGCLSDKTISDEIPSEERGVI